jgi:hypothetical protein
MKRVLFYQRQSGGMHIPMPALPLRSLRRFLLLGTYVTLTLLDGEGNSSIVTKEQTNEREKLLAPLA